MEGEIKQKLGKEESIESAFSILENIQNSTFNKLDDLESIINSDFERSRYSENINKIRNHEKLDKLYEKHLGKDENEPSLNSEILDWIDNQLNDAKSELKNIRSKNNIDDKINIEMILRKMETELDQKLENGNYYSISSILEKLQFKEDHKRNFIFELWLWRNDSYTQKDDLESIINSNFDKSQYSEHFKKIRSHFKFDCLYSKYIGFDEYSPFLKDEVIKWASAQINIYKNKEKERQKREESKTTIEYEYKNDYRDDVIFCNGKKCIKRTTKKLKKPVTCYGNGRKDYGYWGKCDENYVIYEEQHYWGLFGH